MLRAAGVVRVPTSGCRPRVGGRPRRCCGPRVVEPIWWLEAVQDANAVGCWEVALRNRYGAGRIDAAEVAEDGVAVALDDMPLPGSW